MRALDRALYRVVAPASLLLNIGALFFAAFLGDALAIFTSTAGAALSYYGMALYRTHEKDHIDEEV